MPTNLTLSSPPFTHRLREYAELVKFEHTVFALPFALSAMVLATGWGQWPPAATVLWILLAMVGGRTYAMGLNRILDARIDAQNPRTQSRGLPAGRVKLVEAWLLTLGAGALLTGATFQLPILCQQLLPVAFLVLTVYSLMKRFSSLCHLVLGLALGCSAIAGWLAVTGSFNGGLPVVFGLAVLFWVTGFDVIYACQDVDFDQRQGLHSLPAWLGVAMALGLSRVFHTSTVLCLVAFGLWYSASWHPMGLGYWLAVLLTAGMLVYEHRLVKPDDLSQVNEAFFTVNGRISVSVFFLVLADKLWQLLQ